MRPAGGARSAFEPATFRAQGHGLVDALADYLSQALSGNDLPVFPDAPQAATAREWPASFPQVPAPGGDLAELVSRVVRDSIHLHHPRYLGHQVTSPLPGAALAELAGTLLNNAMAVYEMGPAATAMERSLLRWMAGQVGWGDAADGVLTSGGSAGNLTALLAMRQARAGFDIWEHGTTGGPPLAVLAGDQAHYCVLRAIQIMGWGRAGLVPVPSDERFRLDPRALEPALRSARAAGRRVVGVVASACSTATGAFDPLEPIAEFCHAHELWLHVDGAHGAAATLSPRYRHLLAGVERADSLVWDAHKMMLMPALATAVLFRDGDRSHDAFAQQASYLFHGARPREDRFDVGLRTLECTKRMLALPLYAALSLHGTQLFADYVTSTFDLAATFADLLREAPDFELAVEPQSNIVCFRHTPQGAGDLDALQAYVRRSLLEGGGFYVVQTRLPAGLFLRATLIHPFTTEADLLALMDEIRAVARRVDAARHQNVASAALAAAPLAVDPERTTSTARSG
ncbi:MAG: aminotransferase class I/II-fold pyridoxal phosphate-dependent enzyme [Gemmatimonadetes bacterium]|nr:aminotransferase class I/II-fold pyridoxal phosphate-dependent enzyme [Gemmatimonadota bacterium]